MSKSVFDISGIDNFKTSTRFIFLYLLVKDVYYNYYYTTLSFAFQYFFPFFPEKIKKLGHLWTFTTT